MIYWIPFSGSRIKPSPSAFCCGLRMRLGCAARREASAEASSSVLDARRETMGQVMGALAGGILGFWG